MSMLSGQLPIILLLHPLILGLSISLLIGWSLMISGIEYIIYSFFNPRLFGYKKFN